MADILQFPIPSEHPPLIKRVDLSRDEVVLSFSQFLLLLRGKIEQNQSSSSGLFDLFLEENQDI